MKNNVFEDLFVLELANNHWGSIERGKKIITDFSRIVRFRDLSMNNSVIFSTYSQSQIVNLTKIIEEMNQSNENRKVIKAYKSKLKSKFYKIYEFNSKDYLEKVKYKLFHKCCFPHCGRTFSSSGWLKAHFEEHIKDLKKNSFNILFEKFIRNNQHSLFQKDFDNLHI